MHLLLARGAAATDTGEAVDLEQSPAAVAVLSAADTELASLSAAAGRLDLGPDALRLANLLALKHPMSVDTYVERTARRARLVVVRLLGGESYWPHGCEALLAAARRFGFKLCVLPGDERPDPGLARFSTIDPGQGERLWRYLVEGGAPNAEGFLRFCQAILDGGDWPAPARPLPKAGPFARRGASATGRPVAAVVFYRALVQSGQTGTIEALCEALVDAGLDPCPVFVSSLKDPVSVDTVRTLFAAKAPAVVVNLTGFAVSTPGPGRVSTVLEESGAVVLQAVLASTSEAAWRESDRGMSPRDLAMSVALPEIDGRVLSTAVAFKSAGTWDARTQCRIVSHRAVPEQAGFSASLAAAWARLRAKQPAERHVAILLANYPNQDGRLANGVGLDTPAGTVRVLEAMRDAGYDTGAFPSTGNALVEHLLAGATNAGWQGRVIRETLPLEAYRRFFDALPAGVREAVLARWGSPENDPFVHPAHGFVLPLARFGKVMVGVQPARGYNIDPKETYHAPDLVPPHNYLATYAFLREAFAADALVHMGKHGNLEWLPGKALGLSETCFPRAVLGPVPNLCPFIVNDPGEGAQAKRRTSAVIVDHLTPPLTRAEIYGSLRDLERLVDEYYEASSGDPRRSAVLRERILDLLADTGLAADLGLGAGEPGDAALQRLDAYLCELKEMQIRDGLHVFGVAPDGRLLTDLVAALARLPRGTTAGEASLTRALAVDLLGAASPFDPLNCDMAAPWPGPRPAALADLCADPWRTAGDTVERLEILAHRLVAGEGEAGAAWMATRPVLREIEASLKPAVVASGRAEIAGLLAGLDGCFVEPGPSGAPTRGRPDVLPTGRNFFSVDTRAVPTETAWQLGRASAELLVARHLQDHGDWPRAVGLTAWGTANMRTGGDDIAQALALIGAKPVWERASGRVTGFAVLTLAEIGRPRVDVTLRVSGFFRDAFPDQIALFDRACRAVAALDDEGEADNPAAAEVGREAAALVAGGLSPVEARRRAGFRVFGSKPGAYGAGLQALIDGKDWNNRADLAEAYLVWGAYAYGADSEGEAERDGFEARLAALDAVVQNQDNREHDLLDSDDYYQFEGGMSAAAEHLAGRRPVLYHNDHSRPERPVIRTLEEEIGRVVRARVVNPKWIAGVMRHGYKGAFEIAATVDYLFAFAATTGAVRNHQFDLVHEAFVANEAVRRFMEENNPSAFAEMHDRLGEAIRRGLWRPRSNSARAALVPAL